MGRKLKVGINGRPLCHSSIRGLARHTLELIEHLHKEYPFIEIFLYTYGNIHPIFKQRLPFVHIREFHPLVKIFWDLWLLPRALKKDEVLLFHSTNNTGLPFDNRCKKILTVHDDLTHRHRMIFSMKNFWGFLNYLIEFFLLKRANVFITVSETAKEDIVKTMKIPADKIQVIYNGISKPKTSEAFIRENFYLYVGGLDVRKNIPHLILELESAQEKLNRTLHLVLVSQLSSATDELREIIRSSKLSITIKEQINDEELNSLYFKCKMLINPSLYEGFGLPLIEAMLRKTPLIVSNIKVFKEVTNENAYFFSPETRGELSHLIMNIENNKIELNRYCEEGYKIVQRYSSTNMATQTYNIYQQLSPPEENTPAVRS